MPFYDSPAFGENPFATTEINGVKISRADRQPCLICGHPTGDCPGESGPPTKIWGYDTNSTLDEKLTFYMEQDYFEEREIAPGITTKLLIYPKGKYIPLLEAKRLGFL
jgi:hypothetical protein